MGYGRACRREPPVQMQAQVCVGRCVAWLFCEGGECVHSWVTGLNVFVWSVIPGVYVGFSFLAGA